MISKLMLLYLILEFTTNIRKVTSHNILLRYLTKQYIDAIKIVFYFLIKLFDSNLSHLIKITILIK